MRSQLVVSRWFQENGFPNAESTGSGRGGVDILGTVGLAVEVKARAGFEPAAWLKQAEQYAHLGIPTVVFRMNGQGEANVGQWGVLLRLSDYTELVRGAGHGSPIRVSEHPDEQSDGDQQSSHDQQDEDALAPLAKHHRSPKGQQEISHDSTVRP